MAEGGSFIFVFPLSVYAALVLCICYIIPIILSNKAGHTVPGPTTCFEANTGLKLLGFANVLVGIAGIVYLYTTDPLGVSGWALNTFFSLSLISTAEFSGFVVLHCMIAYARDDLGWELVGKAGGVVPPRVQGSKSEHKGRAGSGFAGTMEANEKQQQY